MRDPISPLSGGGTSVRDDWRARLPEDKSKAFLEYARELEATYSMLSVSLNEALELRQAGMVAKSCQVVNVTSGLCLRLTGPLGGLIHVLSEHAKQYGTVPNSAALDPLNFQSARGQRSARMSRLLSKVLLSQRTQFLHKLSTLEEMVEDLSKEFCIGAEELGAGVGTDPVGLWQMVDAAHYDLNTCLRETIVSLKSFLWALPDNQLAHFQEAVGGYWQATAARSAGQILRHRRIAHIAGE